MNASEIRANARIALGQNRYWFGLLTLLIYEAIVAVANRLVSFVLQIFTSLIGVFDNVSLGLMELRDPSDVERTFQSMSLFLGSYIFLLALISVSGFVLAIFVQETLNVGLCKYFLTARTGETDISLLFSGFAKNYMNVVKVNFFKNLFIFLWSLLFIIPGIIKSYEYAAVPYILTVNPDLTDKQALSASKKIMDGHKGELFWLQLTFIGWYLLGIIACCGLGIFFLTPYIRAAEAEFFCYVSTRAVDAGRVNADFTE